MTFQRKVVLTAVLLLTAWISISQLSVNAATEPAPAVSDLKVKLKVPGGWTPIKDFMGMPLVLVGPSKEKDAPKATILFSAPGKNEGAVIDPAKLDDSQDEYQAGRIDWVNTHFGSIYSFIPYKKVVLPSGAEAHVIGVNYKLGDDVYQEKSYTVVCKTEIYFLKSIVPQNQLATQAATVEKTIQSFGCGV